MKPVLLTVGHLQIYAFGVMVVVGLLISLWIMNAAARRRGFPPEGAAWDLVFWAVAAGFLGGRLFYVLQYADWYREHPAKILAVWEGGLVFYGGLAGAMAGLVAVLRIKKIPVWDGLDFLAPFVALTHAFGRIGCFMNGCCYGKASALPWAVRFPGLYGPVHPAQLYEAAYDGLMFAGLLAVYSKRRFAGQVFGLYLACYAAGRFALEYVRTNPAVALRLTLNQWISAAIFLAGVMILVRQRKGAGGISPKRGERA